ncbi:hypothetical protein T4A_9162 [Trichinella pseudospiralis]|uniref:Uncharacterized protein n=1 Tax=Trichinella pseudospiralis TaxID=6337 RepID=A0A0V1EAH0_TRIPS|nr:hypothetical protein T4A_9162 [Trichinella pseudospiralis]
MKNLVQRRVENCTTANKVSSFTSEQIPTDSIVALTELTPMKDEYDCQEKRQIESFSFFICAKFAK